MIAAVATALTLTLLIAIGAGFAALWALEGAKMKAALMGRSWTAAPQPSLRTATVRFSRPLPAVRPLRAAPTWRAAA